MLPESSSGFSLYLSPCFSIFHIHPTHGLLNCQIRRTCQDTRGSQVGPQPPRKDADSLARESLKRTCLVGGFFTNPSEKYDRQNGFILPKLNRGEDMKKYLKRPPRCYLPLSNCGPEGLRSKSKGWKFGNFQPRFQGHDRFEIIPPKYCRIEKWKKCPFKENQKTLWFTGYSCEVPSLLYCDSLVLSSPSEEFSSTQKDTLDLNTRDGWWFKNPGSTNFW